jgi:hypothetical protein
MSRGFATATSRTSCANTVNGNAANGIRVASKNNILSENLATGNAAYPGISNVFDANDTNPDCDNNAWTSNTFGTVSKTPPTSRLSLRMSPISSR